MNIADLVTRLQLWIAGVTLAGLGAFVLWSFNIWKLRSEIKKLKAETEKTKAETEKIRGELVKLQHDQEVRNEAIVLRRRAGILLESGTNIATQPKSSWASFLKNPKMIDDVLHEVSAERVPGQGDLWTIRA